MLSAQKLGTQSWEAPKTETKKWEASNVVAIVHNDLRLKFRSNHSCTTPHLSLSFSVEKNISKEQQNSS